MKSIRRNLASALAELQRNVAQERIRSAIEDAKRHTVDRRRPDILKWYQVDFALELIGSGQSVPVIAAKLHCGPAALYQAIAAVPTRCFYS
jgi:hypothetical protein